MLHRATFPRNVQVRETSPPFSENEWWGHMSSKIESKMSGVVRQWAFGHMQTAKLQASLHIRAVSPEALLFAFNNNRP